MALGISLNLKLKEGEKVTLGQPSSKGSTGLSFTGAVPLNSTVITVSGLSHGKFYVGGIAKTSFTYADYTSGRVQFVHDGSEFAPKFKLSTKIGGVTASYTQPVNSDHFENVNDAAVIVAKRIAIKEGVLTTLSSSALSIKDAEQSSSQLKITLNNSAFDNYEIYKSGALLSTTAGQNTFTYADVTSGKIKFRLKTGHYDSATNIAFTVDDQVNAVNSRVDGHILIQVKTATINVNLAPTITTSTNAFSMAVGGSVKLSPLTLTSPNGSVKTVTTANTALTGLLTINGYTLLDGDRVLVKDQTDASKDGIYVAHSGAWVLAADSANATSLTNKTYTVEKGTEQGKTLVLSGVVGTNLSATPAAVIVSDNNGAPPAGILVTVTKSAGVFFTIDGVKTSTFTMQDVAEGLVFINHNAQWTSSLDFSLKFTDDMGKSSATYTSSQLFLGGLNLATIDVSGDNPNDNVVEENGILSGDLNASVAAQPGLTFTYTLKTTPTFGTVTNFNSATGTFTYTNTNSADTDSFVVTVTASNGMTVDQVVIIDIVPLNHAPTVSNVVVPAIDEGTVAAITVLATDQDGGQLTYSFTQGANGAVVATDANGHFIYTPTGNFNGDDSFVVTVTDAGGKSSNRTVSIHVNPINDAPVFTSPSSYSVSEGVVLPRTLTASDVDSSNLSYGIAPDPSNGTVTVNVNNTVAVKASGTLTVNSDGTFTYTPATNFAGTDSFVVNVSDGTATTLQTITVTVNDDKADAPTGLLLTPSSVLEGATGVNIGTLLGIDPDVNSTFTYTLEDTSGPLEIVTTLVGSSTISTLKLKAGQSLDNTLDNGNSQLLAVAIIVNDGPNGPNGESHVTTQIVNINIVDALRGPVISTTSVSTNEDTVLNGQILATTAAGEVAGTITYTKVSGPAHGSLNVNIDGSYSYNPTANFNGTDSFVVSASSGSGAGTVTSSQTVTITVNPVNDLPSLSVSSFNVAENAVGGSTIATLLSSDVDANETASFFLFSDLSGKFEIVGSSLRLKADASLDFESQSVFSLTVRISDSAGDSVNVPVSIQVTNVNEAPLSISLTPELADSATGLALVNENLLGGVVGTLSAIDSDTGNTHVFSVNDSRFEVVGNVLKLKNANALDFELTQSLSVTVTATDLGGLKVSKSFTILVGDQDDLPHVDALQLNLDERIRNGDGSYAVDATMLHASMAGKGDSAIVFKITSLPNASTYFRLNGVKVAEFTQADVTAGKVSVVLDGTSILPEIKISVGYRDVSGSSFDTADFLPVEFTYGAFNTATLLDLNYEITGTAPDATLGQTIWGDANYFLVGANEYRNSSGDFPEDILIGDNQSSDDRAGNVHAETLDGNRVSAAAVPGGKFVAKMSFYDGAAAGYQYNAEYLLNVNGAGATFFTLPDAATPYANGGSYTITGATVTAANAGDFDKRGLNDLIIADSKADVAGTDGVVRTDAGGAFLVWAEGNTAGVGVANTLAFVANKTDKSTNVQILGAKAGDQTGAALAGNLDMNGDGFSELAINAPMFDSALVADVGAVYLLRGVSVTPTIDLAQALGSNGIRIIGAEANGHIGNILLSGNYDRDFDLATANDRYGDLLIAAKDVDGTINGQADRVDSGEIYLVWGSTSIYNADIKLDSSFTGLRIVGAKAGDGLGTSMINAGDLNGDGFQDLFIGASGVDIGGKANAGAVYVIWGGTHLKTAGKVIDLANLSSSEGFAIYGESAGDLFGSTIALGGDLNADGVQELLVGGRNNGNANDGKVTVIDGALLKAIGQGSASGHAVSYAGDSQDNTFTYDATTDYLVGAQGRGGFDTLAITGSDADVNIQRFNLSGIDAIDLNAAGRQSITLDRRDVVQLGDGFDVNSYSIYLDSLASQKAAGGAIVIPEDHFSTALRVNRAAADAVTLQNFHQLSYLDNSGTKVNLTQVFDSKTYEVYQSDSDEFALVLVQQLPPNHAPTNIALSPANFNENLNVATLIGTLTASDIDVGDAHTFSITDSHFEIRNGNQLWLKAGNAFDFESTPSVSLQVTATDVGGDNVVKTISVAVNDVFERSVLKNKFELVIDERVNALGEIYGEVVVTTDMLNLSANGIPDLRDILVRVDSVVAGHFVNGATNPATNPAASFTMQDVVDHNVKFVTDLSGRVPEIMVSVGVSGQAFEASTHLPLEYSPVNYSLTNALDLNYKIIGTGANSTIIWATAEAPLLMIGGISYNTAGDFPEDVSLWDNFDNDNRLDPEGTFRFDSLDGGRGASAGYLGDSSRAIGGPITQMQFFDAVAQGIQSHATYDVYLTGGQVTLFGDLNYNDVIDAGESWIDIDTPGENTPNTSNDQYDFAPVGGFTFSSVANAGDYDHRSLNDLVIGASNASVLGRAGAGGAFLVLAEGNYSNDLHRGNESGTDLTFKTPQTTDESTYIQILGASAGDAAGTAVAGGDMDKDTFSDIAISAPGFGALDAGAIFLLRGRSVTGTIDLANLNSSIGIKITGGNAGDQIGTSLVNADFDGDGRNDLAIGSSFVDGGSVGLSDSGEVDIVWGRDNLFTTGDITLGNGFTGTRISGGSANDQVGRSLFIYDVDGDGVQDLVIGSPSVDASGLVDAGAVYIIWGGAALKEAKRIDLANLKADQGIAIYGSKAGDAIGTKVVFGSDLNGDNFKELLISGNDQVHVFDGALLDAMHHNGAGVHNRPVFYSGQEQQLGTFYGDNTFTVNTDTDYLVGMDGRTGEDTLAINGLSTFTVSRFNLDGVEVLDLVQRDGSGLPSALDSQTKQTLVIDRRDPVDLIDAERQIAMVNAYSDFIRSGKVGADFSSCLRINRSAQDDIISYDVFGASHLLEVGQQTQFQKLLDANNNVVTQQVGATVYEVWQSTSDAQSLVLMQRLADILGITLTGNTVSENVDGAPYNPNLPLPQPGIVGTVTVIDNDIDDSWTFAIAAPYDAKFEIVTTGTVGHWLHTLKLKDGVHLNYEQDPTILLSITATDRQGHVKTESFTITVLDVAANITVANLVIPENAPGALISVLNFTDPNHIADIASVTLSDSRFTAVKNGNVWELRLKAGVLFNRDILNETPVDNWADVIPGIKITVTDTDGKSFTKSFDFTIEDNAAKGIAENDPGAPVSTLDFTAFDIPSGKGVFAVTVSDTRFEVKQDTSGNYYLKLKAANFLNYELEHSVTLTLQVTLNDFAKTVISREYTFAVDNTATVLTSSGYSIVENVVGAVVGTLNFVDPLNANIVSVTVNDSRFEVTQALGIFTLKLKGNVSLNYEAYAVETAIAAGVSATALAADTTTTLVTAKAFGTTTAAAARADLLAELHDVAAVDTALANLSTAIDLPAALAALNALATALTAAGAAQIPLILTVTDSDGMIYSNLPIIVNITDVNEAPYDLLFSNLSVAENAVAATIGTVTVKDLDPNDSWSFETGDNRFEIVKNGSSYTLKLRTGVSLDYEREQSVTFDVVVKDLSGATGAFSYSESITINVTDVVETSVNKSQFKLVINEPVNGAVVTLKDTMFSIDTTTTTLDKSLLVARIDKMLAGTFKLNGVALTLNDTFTMADVLADRVSFTTDLSGRIPEVMLSLGLVGSDFGASKHLPIEYHPVNYNLGNPLDLNYKVITSDPVLGPPPGTPATTPANPILPNSQFSDIWTSYQGELTPDDPANAARPGSLWDLYNLDGVNAGTQVAVYIRHGTSANGLPATELQDPWVQITDANGNIIVQDDDTGNGNSQGTYNGVNDNGLTYDAYVTFTYQSGYIIRATSFRSSNNGGLGTYTVYTSAGTVVQYEAVNITPPPVIWANSSVLILDGFRYNLNGDFMEDVTINDNEDDDNRAGNIHADSLDSARRVAATLPGGSPVHEMSFNGGTVTLFQAADIITLSGDLNFNGVVNAGEVATRTITGGGFTSAANAGDFDNGGRNGGNIIGSNDIIIGSSGAGAAFNREGAGEAFLVWGEGNLVNGNVAGVTYVRGTDVPTYAQILGADAGDALGSAVSSAGDVNLDGFADILIGATGVDVNGLANAGAVYLIRGTSIRTTLDLATLSPAQGIRITGGAAGDAIGSSLLSNDFDHDGINDLVIGGSNLDGTLYRDAAGNLTTASLATSTDERVDSGEIYLVWGKTSIFTDGDISLGNGFSGLRIVGAAAGDQAGISLNSFGDVDGDGTADLIIGATGVDANGLSNVGAVYIIWGGAALKTTAIIDLGALTASQGMVIYGATAGDQYGSEVVFGSDLNADGYKELVITGGGQAHIVDGALLRNMRDSSATDPNLSGEAIAYTGSEDDDLFVLNAGVNYLIGMDGRSGFDTLRITGDTGANGYTISRFNLDGVDKIDLATDTSSQTINLDRRDVISLPDSYDYISEYSDFASWLNQQNSDVGVSPLDTSLFNNYFTKALRVDVTGADTVNLNRFHQLAYTDTDSVNPLNNSQVLSGFVQVTKDGTLYDVWQSDTDASAVVLIQYIVPNHAPNDLSIADNDSSPTTLAIVENAKIGDADPSGAIVGTITVNDVDVGNTHTFTVKENGALSSRFEVVTVGNVYTLQLKSGVSVDRETEPSISLNVVTQDNVGASYSETFTVTVQDDPAEQLPIILNQTLRITENLRVNSTTVVTTAMIDMSSIAETAAGVGPSAARDAALSAQLIRIDQINGNNFFAKFSSGAPNATLLDRYDVGESFTMYDVEQGLIRFVSDGSGIAPTIKVSYGTQGNFNSSDYLAIEIRPQSYNLANAFDLNYKVTGSGGEGVGVVLKEVTDINGNVTGTLIFNNNGTIYDLGARADFPEDINIWDNLDSDNRTDSTDFGLHADGLDSSRGGSVGHPLIGRQVQMDFFDTYWADPNDVDPVNPNDPNNPDTLDNGAYNDRINFWITISGNRILFDAETNTNGTVTAVIPVNADNGPGGNNEGFPGNRINYDGINFSNDLDGFRGENGILTLPFEATSVANIGDYDNRGQDDLVIGMAGADVLGRVDAGGAFVLFSEGRRAVDDFTDYNGDGELDAFNDANGNGILDNNEALNGLGQEPTYYNDASPYVTNPSWGSRADGANWSPFFSGLPTTDQNQFVQILGATAGDRAGTAASGIPTAMASATSCSRPPVRMSAARPMPVWSISSAVSPSAPPSTWLPSTLRSASKSAATRSMAKSVTSS